MKCGPLASGDKGRRLRCCTQLKPEAPRQGLSSVWTKEQENAPSGLTYGKIEYAQPLMAMIGEPVNGYSRERIWSCECVACAVAWWIVSDVSNRSTPPPVVARFRWSCREHRKAGWNSSRDASLLQPRLGRTQFHGPKLQRDAERNGPCAFPHSVPTKE